MVFYLSLQDKKKYFSKLTEMKWNTFFSLPLFGLEIRTSHRAFYSIPGYYEHREASDVHSDLR